MEKGKMEAMALRVLRWLELQGLKVDYQKLIKRSGGVDQWWISAAEETTGPHPLRVALEHLIAGTGSVQVAHVAAAAHDPAPWQSIVYRPLWLQKWPAMAWTFGFWTVAAIIGYAVGRAFVPYQFRLPYAIVYALATGLLAGGNYLAEQAKSRARIEPTEDVDLTGETSVG